jgi:hypothetical protein
MLKVYEQITGMKKAATKRENEKKELADVVEQDRLIEMKGKLSPPEGIAELIC